MAEDKKSQKRGQKPTGQMPKKPAGQTWESFADSLINRAQSEGAFDHLPGTGKPIPGLDEPYDPSWWCNKLVKREKLSFAPGHLELKRQVEKDLELVWKLTSESKVRETIRRINARIRKANATNISGPPSTLTALNEDETIKAWIMRQRKHGDESGE